MTQPDNEAVPVNLVALQEALFTMARASGAHRAADTVYGGRGRLLRQTAIVLLAGAELGEHASPPEATLQVFLGRVRLATGDDGWELSAGDLMPIPPKRHSLAALEDSFILLSVLLATDAD